MTIQKHKTVFSHPDYTVGSGIPPDQPPSAEAHGLYHRSGFAPCPKDLSVFTFFHFNTLILNNQDTFSFFPLTAFLSKIFIPANQAVTILKSSCFLSSGISGDIWLGKQHNNSTFLSKSLNFFNRLRNHLNTLLNLPHFPHILRIHSHNTKGI